MPDAAMHFARAGNGPEAIGLLINLGKLEKAATLLRRSGRTDEAWTALEGKQIRSSPWKQPLL